MVIPSEPGLLLFCIALRAAAHSYSDTGPSILFFSSSVSFFIYIFVELFNIFSIYFLVLWEAVIVICFVVVALCPF